MRCIKGFVIIVALAIVGGLVVIYSGAINVAATEPHSAFTSWVLSTASDRSIQHHARNINAPSLDGQDMILAGFRNYREMCVGCHLAPGLDSSEIRKGLMPEPPKLQEAAKEWTPAELFWTIKNGIKMTGMPAWGPTHSDEKIWEMVAFVKQLPDMTAEHYKTMEAKAGPVNHEGNHHDADGHVDHHQ